MVLVVVIGLTLAGSFSAWRLAIRRDDTTWYETVREVSSWRGRVTSSAELQRRMIAGDPDVIEAERLGRRKGRATWILLEHPPAATGVRAVGRLSLLQERRWLGVETWLELEDVGMSDELLMMLVGAAHEVSIELQVSER